jgi:hypothetical protein
MRFRLLIAFTALILFIAACDDQPPTMVVLVVTATPEDLTAAVAVTTASPQIASPSPITPSPTPTAEITATLDPRPTATTGQIQIAEQVFEHGRMFWIQPRQQIWVILDEGQNSGKWLVYEDTFQEGEPELDPSIIAPEGMYQPERGFGKLWRSTPEIREQLGFGLTPEFGYVSNYEYHPGGQLNRQNQWELGPGYHILFSLYNERFQLNETDGTWQKIQ